MGYPKMDLSHWDTAIHYGIQLAQYFDQARSGNDSFSPWAKTQIFTYGYHLGGQNLIMFFIYTYAQCLT